MGKKQQATSMIAATAERAEGSSVDEEQDVGPTYDHPPVYTHPEKHYTGVEIDPHGYSVRPFFFFLLPWRCLTRYLL